MTDLPVQLPLVVFAGPRALTTAASASTYYAAGGLSSTVVRPRTCAARNGEFAPGTRFIDDESLAGVGEVRRFLEKQRDALARFSRTPGWFLQQFIKIAAVAAFDAEYVFVADGDTVFSRDLLDAVLREPTILTTGEKFENYDRLLLALGLAPPSMSCVANGNVFSGSPLLRELATPAGFEALMRDHVLPSRGRLDFSEYQLTGGLLEPRLGSRRIRMFRRFDLLVGAGAEVPQAVLARALRRYDAVAVEADHLRSPPKRIAAQLLYRIGRSW